MKKILILFLAPLMIFSQEVTLTGDVDCDGQIGFSDALLVLNDWGPCSACDTDLNDDSAVEFNDMLLLLSNWGVCSK